MRTYFTYTLFLCLAFQLVLLLLPLEQYLSYSLVIPDAFVYSRIAFHVNQGLGPTYDLITMTNGFHPLWMIIHIPLMYGAVDIISRFYLDALFSGKQ